MLPAKKAERRRYPIASAVPDVPTKSVFEPKEPTACIRLPRTRISKSRIQSRLLEHFGSRAAVPHNRKLHNQLGDDCSADDGSYHPGKGGTRIQILSVNDDRYGQGANRPKHQAGPFGSAEKADGSAFAHPDTDPFTKQTGNHE